MKPQSKAILFSIVGFLLLTLGMLWLRGARAPSAARSELQKRSKADRIAATNRLLQAAAQRFPVPGNASRPAAINAPQNGLPGVATTTEPPQSADGQISASALREIQAMQQEKASFTPAQRKLDSQLVFALKQSRNEPVANGHVPHLRIGVQADAYGMVQVDISAKVTPNLLQEI